MIGGGDWTISEIIAEKTADLELQVEELARALRTANAQLEIERQAVAELAARLAAIEPCSFCAQAPA